MEVTRPNQVWVSDITYIRTVKGFCYLALITDMYSRKIVGHDLSDSLELNGCVRALDKALYQAKDSMTEENHYYENAMAERVNGILKDEFYLDQVFTDATHAKRAAKNAIKLYNEIRLHLSLNYRTPNMVYKLTV
mgnify:CR=1 FL=1